MKINHNRIDTIADWLAEILKTFPTPWIIKPRDGKYYGTIMQDARGKDILSIWINEDQQPSWREKNYFGQWTPERWNDAVCDSHWESELSLKIAEEIITLRNENNEHMDEDIVNYLIPIILRCRWEQDVWNEVDCGGPGETE